MTANPGRERTLYRLSDLFVHAYNLVRQDQRSVAMTECLMDYLQAFRENRLRRTYDGQDVARIRELVLSHQEHLVWEAFLAVLPTRARNTVLATEAKSVISLAKMSHAELYRYRNCGRFTIEEIDDHLRKYFGLRLGMSDADLKLVFGQTETTPADLGRRRITSFLQREVVNQEFFEDLNCRLRLRQANLHIGMDLVRLSPYFPPRNLTTYDLEQIEAVLETYGLRIGMTPSEVDRHVRQVTMPREQAADLR